MVGNGISGLFGVNGLSGIRGLFSVNGSFTINGLSGIRGLFSVNGSFKINGLFGANRWFGISRLSGSIHCRSIDCALLIRSQLPQHFLANDWIPPHILLIQLLQQNGRVLAGRQMHDHDAIVLLPLRLLRVKPRLWSVQTMPRGKKVLIRYSDSNSSTSRSNDTESGFSFADSSML